MTEEYLKHSLLYTNSELEKTILCAHEEIARKEEQLVHLKGLLTKTIKERDDAQSNCQSLMLDKLLLQQQLKAAAASLTVINPSNIQDETTKGVDSISGFSSSGCDDNATSPPPQPHVGEKLVAERLLPENGKFLQAVREAGPLLHTLLLAGPLPEWQHPPPQLNTTDIPPVSISSPRGRVSVQQEEYSCLSKKKRGCSSVDE